MAERLPFRLVDAFAERPYRGNPAGVVFDADQLTPVQMQLIAREVGASETAFLSGLQDLHAAPRLRWFTPTAEVQFCGHATLAAAHALADSGALSKLLAQPEPIVKFTTAAGLLRLTPEKLPPPYDCPCWWLQMPNPGLKPDFTNPMKTCEHLGLHHSELDPGIPPMRTRDDDVIYFIKDWTRLQELAPPMDALATWCKRSDIRGICVATTNTLTPAVQVHSRFFAPAVGIHEDPVTGSVHGPLAALLVTHNLLPQVQGVSSANCMQGHPGGRGGLVRALVQATDAGYEVTLGGVCFTSIVGEIAVPPVRGDEVL